MLQEAPESVEATPRSQASYPQSVESARSGGSTITEVKCYGRQSGLEILQAISSAWLAAVSLKENGDGTDHDMRAIGLNLHAIHVAVIQGAVGG